MDIGIGQPWASPDAWFTVHVVFQCGQEEFFRVQARDAKAAGDAIREELDAIDQEYRITELNVRA